MLVAEVIDGKVMRVVDCRELCEWYPPTDEQLRDRNLVRVSLFREHDPATQQLVPCEPVLEGDWVYTMAVVDVTPIESAALVGEISVAGQDAVFAEYTPIDL